MSADLRYTERPGILRYYGKRTDDPTESWWNIKSRPPQPGFPVYRQGSTFRPINPKDRGKSKDGKHTRRNVFIVVLALIVAAVIITVPIAVTYINRDSDTRGAINLKLKLAEEFQPGMADPSSSVYKSTEEELCRQVQLAFTFHDSFLKDVHFECELPALRNGSFIAELIITISGSYSIPQNTVYVIAISEYAGTSGTFGSFTIVSGSVYVTAASYRIDGEITAVTSAPTTTTTQPPPTTPYVPPSMLMDVSTIKLTNQLRVECEALFVPQDWTEIRIRSADDSTLVVGFTDGTTYQNSHSYQVTFLHDTRNVSIRLVFPNTQTYCSARGTYVCSLAANGTEVINTEAAFPVTELTLEGNITPKEGRSYDISCTATLETDGGVLHLYTKSTSATEFVRSDVGPAVTIGNVDDDCYRLITKTYSFVADRASNGTEMMCTALKPVIATAQTIPITIDIILADFRANFRLENTTWSLAYADKNSPEFRALADSIEQDVDFVYNTSSLRDNYKRSTVLSLTEGSVNVELGIEINLYVPITDSATNVVTATPNAYDLISTFVETLTFVSSQLPNGVLAGFDTSSMTGSVITADNIACNSKTDLVFLVDSSGSVGYDNFQTMKYFILNFTATVAIDDNSLRVGVVTFSTSTTNEIWLRDYRSAIDLLHGIISITYSPGWTFMSDGLNFVRSNSFSAQNGARPDAHKVIILMTDGVATDDPLPVAQTLRDENVLVICIGIGSSVDVQQLTAIAYNSTYVFQVQDYDALLGVKDTVQSSSCSVRTNG